MGEMIFKATPTELCAGFRPADWQVNNPHFDNKKCCISAEVYERGKHVHTSQCIGVDGKVISFDDYLALCPTCKKAVPAARIYVCNTDLHINDWKVFYFYGDKVEWIVP